MVNAAYTIERDGHPVVATAVHAGHELRDEVASLMALDDSTRLREEDPYTDAWTQIARNRVIVHRSRFEIDLNRPPHEAVCWTPEDCWDLEVWHKIPDEVAERSLGVHERFYSDLRRLLQDIERRHGAFVVYDLHSYNHRRLGYPADPEANPEVNLGTGTLDRVRWAHVVDRFMETVCAHDFRGRRLDVRENVKFRGGYLPRWIHQNFPETGCALAIDVKKIFMDEHTADLDEGLWNQIHAALDSSVPNVLDALGKE